MKASTRPRTRARPHHEPGPIRAWVRIQWHQTGAPLRCLHTQMLRFQAHTTVEKARWWRGRGVQGWFIFAAAWFGVLLLALRLYGDFRGFSVFGFKIPPKDPSIRAGYYAVLAILVPYWVAAVGYLFFLLWRVLRLRSPYRKIAIKQPKELAPTAGTILGDVVGRDDLCRAIMEDLRDRGTRRPHVIVGGVGAGKTAVLVRLTTLLAQKHAVPVPLRLRDYGRKLDFRNAGHDRFCDLAALMGFPAVKADKIWQQLCKDNKIVVLADGLEEALQDLGAHDDERDNMIRLAIHDARKEKLPLVIASRPHAPLQGMEASMTELEPLGERDALQYLRRHGITDDDALLQWIVETADVSESPLYLQITDELNGAKLLDRVAAHFDWARAGESDADRMGLRVRLLESWTDAVVKGYLHHDAGVENKADREATLEQLSALACAGLRMDSLYVRFSDFTDSVDDMPKGAAENEKNSRLEQCGRNAELYREIHARLQEKLDQLQRRRDLQLAATHGQQLGLVEPHGDGIRFQHSIMQAYLGSRYMDVALSNQRYMDSALEDPGREFLIALAMSTRNHHNDVSPDVSRAHAEKIFNTLFDDARERLDRKLDVKTVDLYATAAQVLPETGRVILGTGKEHGFTGIVKAVRDLIRQTQQEPEKVFDAPGSLEAAKLQFVQQLGEAMRRAEGMHRHDEPTEKKVSGDELRLSYRALFDLSVCEPSYAVRVAAAAEIGAGSDVARQALLDRLAPIRLSPAAQQELDKPTEAEELLRGQIMRAWLAPMLVASAAPQEGEGEHKEGPGKEPETLLLSRHARRILEDWLEYVIHPGPAEPFPVNLKIALAQGFRFAANKRVLDLYAQAESRAYLAERAKDMLHGVDFWYSRIALLHALTLWSLPDRLDDSPSDYQPRLTGEQEEAHRHRQQQSPDALVKQWLVMRVEEAERASKESSIEHPFVDQAARLCVFALESQQPDRFMWIDESGVLSKTGYGPVRTVAPPRRRQWIPQSAGWSALAPRAQQLVADVLVFLNLAEGGRAPMERERRLAGTGRAVLPVCLTKDRGPLDPLRTIGAERLAGRQTRCASACLFALCPYPLKGEQAQHARAELSEAFCRRQRVLLGFRGRIKAFRFRLTAPWQGETKTRLKHFWEDMGQRSRR